MDINPDYGETPVDPDEASALTPQARQVFGNQPTKVEIYEAEEAIAIEVSVKLLSEISDSHLVLEDLLTDAFLRNLHWQLYGELWMWAGRYRTRKLSIGIDPAYIAVELRTSLDNIHYRWNHTSDWTHRELGIAAHAETVRIHGFVDGNGRATRLLADLIFFAAQEPEEILERYDWAIDKKHYIALLKEYDFTRDPKKLAAFIPVRRLDA